MLPQTYAPVVRYPRFYGLNGRDTGLNFRFDYRFVYKNRRFEDEFFAFLTSHGTAGPLTAFQQA